MTHSHSCHPKPLLRKLLAGALLETPVPSKWVCDSSFGWFEWKLKLFLFFSGGAGGVGQLEPGSAFLGGLANIGQGALSVQSSSTNWSKLEISRLGQALSSSISPHGTPKDNSFTFLWQTARITAARAGDFRWSSAGRAAPCAWRRSASWPARPQARLFRVKMSHVGSVSKWEKRNPLKHVGGGWLVLKNMG